MNRKSMNGRISARKWTLYIIPAICLTVVITWNYVPDVRQSTEYPWINALLYLFYSMNAYGLIGTVLTVAFAVLIAATDCHRKKYVRRLPGVGVCAAILFGVANVCGLWMFFDDILTFGHGLFLFCAGLFQAFGYAILFAIAEYWVLYGLDYMEQIPWKSAPLD